MPVAPAISEVILSEAVVPEVGMSDLVLVVFSATGSVPATTWGCVSWALVNSATTMFGDVYVLREGMRRWGDDLDAKDR